MNERGRIRVYPSPDVIRFKNGRELKRAHHIGIIGGADRPTTIPKKHSIWVMILSAIALAAAVSAVAFAISGYCSARRK